VGLAAVPAVEGGRVEESGISGGRDLAISQEGLRGFWGRKGPKPVTKTMISSSAGAGEGTCSMDPMVVCGGRCRPRAVRKMRDPGDVYPREKDGDH